MANKIKYALTKFFLHTFGRMSHGVRLCLKEGLTSGKTVDYVYRNQPEGILGIGKIIDQLFLEHPGWEAVRSRRQNLEALLLLAIRSIREKSKPITIVDIASGPAAYILSALKKAGDHDIFAICRDFEERWLIDGAQAAKSWDLERVRFEKGDAFDSAALIQTTPRPNLIVSSGFYDWIIEDEKVKKSLKTIHQALDQGGYLVMTNQAAHPDQEFVQSIFSDFKKSPLRMVMRSKECIHEWLEEVGFRVENTLSDSQGYYTVTKACKA